MESLQKPPHLYAQTGTLAWLRVHLWIFLLLEAIILLVLYLLLTVPTINPTEAGITPGRWLGLSLLVAIVELWITRRNLAKNHRQDEPQLLPTLGAANFLTISRGLAYAMMAGFLLAPRPGGWLDWVPALLYATACIVDFFDGYIARMTDHTTELGKLLDMEFDGLGMLIAIGLAVQYGQLPAAYLLIGLARPLFVAGLAIRRRLGKIEHPMTPSSTRRLVAGVQMGFVAFILWPIVSPPISTVTALIFGMAVILSFARDWLVVAGWLDPATPAYVRWRRIGKRLLFLELPSILRLASGFLVFWILFDRNAWGELQLLAAQSTVNASLLMPGLVVAVCAAALMVLLGVLTRLAALVLILLAVSHVWILDAMLWNMALLATGSLLILLGSGRNALWSPDEYLFHHHIGGERLALNKSSQQDSVTRPPDFPHAAAGSAFATAWSQSDAERQSG